MRITMIGKGPTRVTDVFSDFLGWDIVPHEKLVAAQVLKVTIVRIEISVYEGS